MTFVLPPGAAPWWAIAAFVTGGAIGVVLLLTGSAGLRSHIAFGPSMILGAWVALMLPVTTVTG